MHIHVMHASKRSNKQHKRLENKKKKNKNKRKKGIAAGKIVYTITSGVQGQHACMHACIRLNSAVEKCPYSSFILVHLMVEY